MYNETVTWYFDRLQKVSNNTFELDVIQPGDARQYKLVSENGSRDVSPRLRAREFKIWIDAFTQGIKHEQERNT